MHAQNSARLFLVCSSRLDDCMCALPAAAVSPCWARCAASCMCVEPRLTLAVVQQLILAVLLAVTLLLQGCVPAACVHLTLPQNSHALAATNITTSCGRMRREDARRGCEDAKRAMKHQGAGNADVRLWMFQARLPYPAVKSCAQLQLLGNDGRNATDSLAESSDGNLKATLRVCPDVIFGAMYFCWMEVSSFG